MGKFLIPFLILTSLEVYLMAVVAEKTSFPLLLGIVILTGFVGISLAKFQGKMHLKNIQEELSAGRVPGNPLIEGLMILVAAAVLITPGFITDFLGFLLLVPFVRKMVAPRVAGLLKPKSSSNSSFVSFGNQPNQGAPKQDVEEADFFDMPSQPGTTSSDSTNQLEDNKEA
jgi:UPF0716 protein FxsA